MEPGFRASIEAHILKRKPPKLKNVDRTISLALDNYVPGTSGIVMDPSLMMDEDMLPTMVPPPLSVPVQDAKKSTIFYMGGGGGGAPHPEYHSHHVPHVTHGGHTSTASRKQNMRRSDTLDVYTADIYEMRKTNSFNANDGASIEDAINASRRTSSMRSTGTAGYTHDFDTIETKPVSPMMAHAGEVPHGAQPTRRNCRMHKSLYDPHRARHEHTKKEQSIDGMKCHSVGDDDDGIIGGARRKLSPKFNSAGASLDNEVFHMRSGSSRSTVEVETAGSTGDIIELSAMPKKASMQAAVIAAASGVPLQSQHKHSSHSLDKAHSFRRIARATQSFYLNPNSYDELRLQRGGVTVGPALPGGKKAHSASMRTKPFRETLSDAKKSKSFVADPFGDYELSPHRRDSKMFVTNDVSEIKKSPRLGASDGIAAMAAIALARASYEQRKGSDYDPSGLDYDAIMRAYRQNRRKSSVASAGKKTKSKKSSIDADADIDGDDSESSRKRRKIVCIIITVFFSIVFASVFVVVFTLTNSPVSPVLNHTKKVQTYSRDTPLHSLHINAPHNIGKIHALLSIHLFYSRKILSINTLIALPFTVGNRKHEACVNGHPSIIIIRYCAIQLDWRPICIHI